MFGTPIISLCDSINSTNVIPTSSTTSNGIPTTNSIFNGNSYTSHVMIPVDRDVIISQNNQNMIINNSTEHPNGTRLEDLISAYKNGNMFSLKNITPRTDIPLNTNSPETSETDEYVLYRKYSAEFKKQAIELFFQSDISIKEFAQKFNIPCGTFSGWITKAKLMKEASCLARQKDQAVESHDQDYISESNFPCKSGQYYFFPEEKEALELYHQGKITLEESSKKFDVRQRTLQNFICGSKNRTECDIKEKDVAVALCCQNDWQHGLFFNSSTTFNDNSSKVEKEEPVIKLISLSMPILVAIDSIQKMIAYEHDLDGKRIR